MKHSIVTLDGVDSVVTVFHDGEIYTAVREAHPNFAAIVKAVRENVLPASDVVDLFDLSIAVAKRFEKVSDRVSLAGGTVYFDGDAVHNTLTQQIIRFFNEGVENWKPLVNFMEKVMDNPNENSRDQLFLWLDNGDFTITPNGDFVGYKGVRINDGVAYSTHNAPAKDRVTVNGEPVVGKPVPNRPGDVVEMPRSVVDSDEDRHCSVGLHIGTWDYANSFGGGNVLEVHVNPRDVVSVTSDSARQKIRACRYRVVDFIEGAYESASLYDEVDGEFDNDFSEDEEFLVCNECYEYVDALDENDVCQECASDIAAEEAREEAQRVWDTRQNFTRQQRGADGKFIRKV